MIYEAVIFDLWGTLVPGLTQTDYRKSVRATAEALCAQPEAFETLWISHKRKPAGPPTRQYWRYTEHQQLPDGRWYPTKWQAHALAIANTGKGRWANQSYIMDDAEFRLRVYPGMKVDNSKLAKPSMSR